MSLLPVEEAQARLLSLADPLPVETVGLLSANGRYLAEPMAALRDQPWADLSAMDGYAIRHADLPGPWLLAGESRAGGTPPQRPLQPREAMRIFTGAPLPDGADCILVQEEAFVADGVIHLSGEGPEKVGRNVRHRGSDFTQGVPLLPAGIRIGPAQIALAATAGHASLSVRRPPRIALLSTGDELVAIGAMAGPGKLPASNGVMLAAMLAGEQAEIIDLGLIPDDLDAITSAFRSPSDVDIILSTGGASVGDHDLVGPALRQAGADLDFWKVAMRPGKPLMAGRLGKAVVLGLPGNPVSAFVTASLFLLPLVRHMKGAANPVPAALTVPCDVALPRGGARAEYLRGTLIEGHIVRIADRDSAALLPLAGANMLVERAIDAPPIPAGETVRAIPVGNGTFPLT